MIYILLGVVACLLLYSCGRKDRHPDYPGTFVDNVNISFVKTQDTEQECIGAVPIMVKGKTMYLKDSHLYNIRGDLMQTSSLKQLFPDSKIRFTGERTFTGHYIFRMIYGDSDTFYIFDFDNDCLSSDIMKLDYKDYLMEELPEKLKQRLDSLQMKLPEIPLMKGHWMYSSSFPEDKERFNKLVRENYKKAIMDFAVKYKNEVYLYDNTYLVFLKKGVAFMIEEEIGGIGEFPSLIGSVITTMPICETKTAPVSLHHTGSVFLGYGTESAFGLPIPKSNGHINYWRLVCEGQTFNFKLRNNSGSYPGSLYDYEQTDHKIYFVMSSSATRVTLYEYHRKVN